MKDAQFAVGFACGALLATAAFGAWLSHAKANDPRPTRNELVRAGLAEWTVDEYGYVDFRMKVNLKDGAK